MKPEWYDLYTDYWRKRLTQRQIAAKHGVTPQAVSLWMKGSHIVRRKPGKPARAEGKLVQCTKCGRSFPWDAQHFVTRHSQPAQCVQPCKECHRAIDAQYKREQRA